VESTSRFDRIVHSAAALSLLLVAALFACNKRTNEVLVINEPWSVQRAEADCKSRAAIGIPLCKGSPENEIRSYSAEISDAFKSDPACTGITLLTLSPDSSQVMSHGSWWLFLELSRGEEDRLVRYTVSRSNDPDAPYSLAGNVDTRQAASAACKFIRGKIGAP
jgi:hypothetical protein